MVLQLPGASYWSAIFVLLAVSKGIFYLLISLKHHTMANLKLMVWNMEWMNDLFAGNGLFRPDNEKTQHNSAATIKQRRDALSTVIKELNPDILWWWKARTLRPNGNCSLTLTCSARGKDTYRRLRA